MTKQQEIKTLAEELSKIGYRTPHTVHAQVTYMKDPNTFYCRITKYLNILQFLQKPGKWLLSSELSIGLIVIFNSKRIKTKVRGQIIKMDNNSCTMFAIDYGFIEDEVSTEDNRRVTTDFPPIALPCVMANCLPLDGTFSGEAIKHMKEFVKTWCYLTIYSKVNNKYLVSLANHDMVDDIATILLYFNTATPSCINNAVSRHCIPSPKIKYTTMYRTLNVGEQIIVRSLAVNNVNDQLLDSFYVAPINEYKEYLNERKTYINTNDIMEEKNMKPGVLVTTKLDNRDERAIISTFSNRVNIGIDLLDLGGSMQISVEALKMMPISLMKNPGRAIFCSAVNVSKKYTGKIFRPGQIFVITVLEAGNKFYKPNKVKVNLLKHI